MKLFAVLCNNRYGHECQHNNSELFTYICELFNKRPQKVGMRKISYSSLTGTALYADSEMRLDNPTPLQPVEQQKRQHRKGKLLICRKLLQSCSRRSYFF